MQCFLAHFSSCFDLYVHASRERQYFNYLAVPTRDALLAADVFYFRPICMGGGFGGLSCGAEWVADML